LTAFIKLTHNLEGKSAMSTIFSDFSLDKIKFRRTKLSPLARREAWWGVFFLSPWIIGFLVWYLLPMIASLIFSFTTFNLVHPEDIEWIGLANYAQFFRDPVVLQSVGVSLRFALLAVPIAIIQPVLMAAMLNDKRLWAKRFFTTLFYMPFIVPLVSAVYIWRGVMNDQTGWINMFLKWLGITPPDWLNSPVWIYPALIIIGLWATGNALIFTLTAMQGIPTELYDAARVDGAGRFATFIHITLPMITPIIFYNLILTVIGIVQYFLIPFVLKGGTGEPGNTTRFYAMQLFKEAFAYSNMGYGATMAWLLFVFTLGVTAFLFATAKYWVFYAGGED
jgi:multiple sugar transport system permease protein